MGTKSSGTAKEGQIFVGKSAFYLSAHVSGDSQTWDISSGLKQTGSCLHLTQTVKVIYSQGFPSTQVMCRHPLSQESTTQTVSFCPSSMRLFDQAHHQPGVWRSPVAGAQWVGFLGSPCRGQVWNPIFYVVVKAIDSCLECCKR